LWLCYSPNGHWVVISDSDKDEVAASTRESSISAKWAVVSDAMTPDAITGTWDTSDGGSRIAVPGVKFVRVRMSQERQHALGRAMAAQAEAEAQVAAAAVAAHREAEAFGEVEQEAAG
jgi:hypothetical protein